MSDVYPNLETSTPTSHFSHPPTLAGTAMGLCVSLFVSLSVWQCVCHCVCVTVLINVCTYPCMSASLYVCMYAYGSTSRIIAICLKLDNPNARSLLFF